jgi:N-acetylglucosaminyl-diphospho-decaprenol L-rhamnosyltransferase
MDGISGRASIPVCGPYGVPDWRASVFQGHEVDVSIIIVNWNTRDLLRSCLQALASARGGVRAQVLVVDNGSIDGSPVLVAEEFPWVELVRNSENVGFARANNQAYQQARGRYVLLLNPDTEMRGGSIELMVEFLDADSQRAGVTAVLRNLDGTVQRYHKRLPRWRYVLFSETILRNLFPRNRWTRAFYMYDEPFQSMTEVEQPPAACLMLRQSILAPSSLFDEQFPIFYNDVDLCRWLYDRGHRLFLLPGAEVMHHGGAGGVCELPDQGIIDSLIGLVRYYRKHEGRLCAGVLWLILTANSLLVLGGGLGKVVVGRRSPQWWGHELAKRVRLAIGQEAFHYPKDMNPDLMSCVVTCRH